MLNREHWSLHFTSDRMYQYKFEPGGRREEGYVIATKVWDALIFFLQIKYCTSCERTVVWKGWSVKSIQLLGNTAFSTPLFLDNTIAITLNLGVVWAGQGGWEGRGPSECLCSATDLHETSSPGRFLSHEDLQWGSSPYHTSTNWKKKQT